MRCSSQNIPTNPGVYLYKNNTGKVLYIGKAKNLRKRVSSYWQQEKNLEPHKRMMLSQVETIETIITDNEIEALMLESTLVRKYQPPYNIILKDDKSYSYIKITHKDIWPVVSIVRRPTFDHQARYFGPYLSTDSVQSVLRTMQHIFPYKTSEQGTARPCLQYYMGRCTDPCMHLRKVSAIQSAFPHAPYAHIQSEYQEIIKRIIQILEGDIKPVKNYIEQQMHQATLSQNFEQSAKWRDRLFSLQKLHQEQKMIQTNSTSQDIISLLRDDEREQVIVNIFKIRQGRVLDKINLILAHTKGYSLPEILTSFLLQYYPQSPDVPKEIITPYLPTMPVHAIATAISKHLSVRIKTPTRGEKYKMIQLGMKNAEEYAKKMNRGIKPNRANALINLKALLTLSTLPNRIECYDISNIQGANPVGSMTVFVHGWPAKDQYRKFQIKTVHGSNDCAMMKEILMRRFGRHRGFPPHVIGGELHNTDKKLIWPMPDLVIVDGGKGQLSTALEVFEVLHLDIPIIALAKREEEIFIPNRGKGRPHSPFTLKKLSTNTTELQILQHIRDEAHRFAITYHRTRRNKEATTSLLDSIPGIGAIRKKQLLIKFGTIQGIRQATDDQLSLILGKKLAQIIREYV